MIVTTDQDSSVEGSAGCQGRRQTSMAAEKRDNEYDGGRDARGKAQAYWAGKLERFTQRNGNVGTAMSERQCRNKRSNG